ncbi:MAG: LbetaH domain-containing protein [Planctomycetota bacterium]
MTDYLSNPNGDLPEVHPTAYIDPAARLIGRVLIGPRVFVAPNAVIRADEPGGDGSVEPIVIEAECNIQDGVIIHALSGTRVSIGKRISVAHGAILHGPCTIGEGCFIGFGATVFKGQLGSGVFVSARAVVQETQLPDDTFIPPLRAVCSPTGEQLRTTTADERSFMEEIVNMNLQLLDGYLALNRSES